MARFQTVREWLAWQETLHPNAIELGLDRVRRTLQRLNWRQPDCPVITIGGTNGKGSCAALTAAILKSAGYRVGVFTSPHIHRYHERISLDGREISDASLIAAFERIDAARGADTLTFFEFNTLAALLTFETACVDAMVLEVGMGGRLDAVNVVDADAAIVTSVALDHCEWLGHDVEAIGREKAGVFRSGRPAVFGSRARPASIDETARSIGARLLALGRDFDWRRDGERWTWRGEGVEWTDLPPPALSGEIQYDNASAVLCGLMSLSDRLQIGRAAIEQGLREVSLRGRFQRVHKDVEWVLDVAHNPAAARTLAQQLAATRGRGRTIGVCGMLGDKDAQGVAAELNSAIDVWIAAGLSGPRAIAPEQLAERLESAGAHVARSARSVAAACAAARALASPADRIIVFGSFLTVADGLTWLDSA